MRVERALHRGRRGDGRLGAGEDGEERVALGLDLDPRGRRQGGPDDRLVGLQQVRPGGRAEALHEPGRALDVGEEERDGAGREGRARGRGVTPRWGLHGPMVGPVRGARQSRCDALPGPGPAVGPVGCSRKIQMSQVTWLTSRAPSGMPAA